MGSGFTNHGIIMALLLVFFLPSNETATGPKFELIFVWGFGEAKQPWKAEELLRTMEDTGLFPEDSTTRPVADAWQSIGLINEAKRVMNIIKHDIHAVEKAHRNEMPAESLERIYQIQSIEDLPKVLQTTGFLGNNQNEAASSNSRNQMFSRQAKTWVRNASAGRKLRSSVH